MVPIPPLALATEVRPDGVVLLHMVCAPPMLPTLNAPFTTMEIVLDVLPPLLLPVMVYEVCAWLAVGVPVITPVLLSNVSPEGRELGEME